MFASADVGEPVSTLRIWNVDRPPAREEKSLLAGSASALSFDALSALPQPPPPPSPPDRLQMDAPVTSIQWSTLAKEILTTHGPTTVPPVLVNGVPRPAKYANAVAVHSYRTLGLVSLQHAGDAPLTGSVMSPNGQRIVLVFPDEKKLKVWDVWKPMLRRTGSKTSFDSIGIR